MLKRLKIFISLLIATTLCFYPSLNYGVPVLILYFLIISFSSTQIVIAKEKLSAKSMFYLFIYIFFGIAPVLQYKNWIIFFGESSPLFETDFLKGAILVMFIIFFFEVCSPVLIKKTSELNIQIKSLSNIKYSSNKLYAIIGVFTFIVLVINYNNIPVLFLRYEQSSDTSLSHIILTLIDLTISFVPLIMLIILKQSHKIKLKDEVFLLTIILLFSFPTAVSRLEIALIYLTLLVAYFRQIRKFFSELVLLSVIFLFPLFNMFRLKNTDGFSVDMFYKQFLQAHFDSFQNTITAINLNLITYGDQLIASLFFFIPRALWSSKPNASSELICAELKYDGYCNIALSFFGEGYINFGYFGVIFFTLVLVVYIVFLDENYRCNNFFGLGDVYLLFVIHLFYMLRGSLTAAFIKLFVLIIAIALSLLALRWICKK